MNCHEAEAHYEDWLEDRAPSEAADHIKGCESCQSALAGFDRASAWMALLQKEPPQLSPGFWVRFWEKQAANVGDFWEVLAVLGRRAAVGLAVLILVLAVSFQWVQQTGEAERAVIDAPQPYWAQFDGQENGNGNGPNREQVVLTLVAQTE
jgi:hypothetical protein